MNITLNSKERNSFSDIESKSMKNFNILYVGEGDTSFQLLKNGLGIYQIGVNSIVKSAKCAIELLSHTIFDALIIRNDLPDMDGRDLSRLLRRKKIDYPIIIVSNEGSAADEILALDSGANDFVTTGINPYVLTARIRAHIRYFIVSGRANYQLGRFIFDPSRRIIMDSCSTNSLLLTETESSLLTHFCASPNTVVTSKDLLNTVWDYSDASISTTVKTHIYNLRKKVSANLTKEDFLIKVRGGYRLAA